MRKIPSSKKKRASEHLLRQMGSEVSPTTDSLKSLDKIGGKTTFSPKIASCFILGFANFISTGDEKKTLSLLDFFSRLSLS